MTCRLASVAVASSDQLLICVTPSAEESGRRQHGLRCKPIERVALARYAISTFSKGRSVRAGCSRTASSQANEEPTHLDGDFYRQRLAGGDAEMPPAPQFAFDLAAKPANEYSGDEPARGRQLPRTQLAAWSSQEDSTKAWRRSPVRRHGAGRQNHPGIPF